VQVRGGKRNQGGPHQYASSTQRRPFWPLDMAARPRGRLGGSTIGASTA
jgi:hypothetical protein